MAVSTVRACVFVCFCVSVLVTATAEDDRLVFPGDSSSCQECDLKIPLEVALKLNSITDEKQLFREFMQDDVEAPMVKSIYKSVAFSASGSVSDRFGGEEEEQVERKAFSKPKPAGCIPELRSVSLRESTDPWIYYWPSCTRLEQCGGCCSHKLLSCQPVETELLNFQVVVTEYVGNQLKYKGKEVVTREKHTKCKCDCITKASDCNALQEYRKGECRCVCMNKDAEAKCLAQSETKHWNPDSCSCQCLKVFECSTGTIFNEATCSCEVPETSKVERLGTSSPDEAPSTTKIPFKRRWPINYLFGNGK